MKKKILLIAFVYVFIHLDMLSQSVPFNPKIEKALPFPNSSVVLEPSWIKDREELNTMYLKSLDPDRLLHNFRVTNLPY